MSWPTNREDAAKHPRRVLAFILVAGLVAGGAIGYLRFDRSVAWSMVLGLAFAAILRYVERRALRDTARANGPAPSLDIHALARLAAPFVVLVIAYLVGIVTESVEAFVVVCAAGLALLLVVRFTIWR